MRDILFDVTGTNINNISDLMSNWFGYKCRIKGNIIFVPRNDPKLRSGPGKIIENSPIIPITDAQAAQRISNLIGDEYENFLEEARQNLDDDLNVPGDLGFLSEQEKVTLEFMFNRIDEHNNPTIKRLINFFSNNYPVTHSSVLTLKAEKIQHRISFARNLYRIQLGQDPFQNDDGSVPFEGIDFTGGFDFLYLVDVMMRLFPLPFSLPARRGWHVLHFFGDGWPNLGHSLLHKGVYQSLLSQSNPRSNKWHYGVPLKKLSSFSSDDIFRMLLMCCDAVNRIGSFILDHRNHVDEKGVFNYFEQMRIFSIFSMIVSDIVSVHMNPSPHSQISFLFSLSDKLANLRYNYNRNRNEYELFCEMYSQKFLEKCLKSLQGHPFFTKYDFGRSFICMYKFCFNDLHKTMDSELGCSSNEQERIDRIRSFRNLNHGAFLKKAQFEKLYAQSSGALPATLINYTQLTLLAVMLNPKELIKGES